MSMFEKFQGEVQKRQAQRASGFRRDLRRRGRRRIGGTARVGSRLPPAAPFNL